MVRADCLVRFVFHVRALLFLVLDMRTLLQIEIHVDTSKLYLAFRQKVRGQKANYLQLKTVLMPKWQFLR